MEHKLVQVSPQDVSANPWNSNVMSPENEAKLQESIRKLGMFKPIVVRQLANGAYQVIGGEHRLTCAKRMGMKSIPAFCLGQIDDVSAKRIGLQDNNRFGEDDTLKLADIFSGIGTVEELASYMPLTSSDIDSIFSASSVAIDILDSLDLPQESVELPEKPTAPTHQTMRFKVPVSCIDQVTQVIAQAIKKQGFSNDDSQINAGDALAYLLLKE